MAAVTHVPSIQAASRPLEPSATPYVEELSAAEHAAWDAYALGHAHATLYHLRAWQPIAEHAYRLQAPFLADSINVCRRLRCSSSDHIEDFTYSVAKTAIVQSTEYND